jgi:hypothetical protein
MKSCHWQVHCVEFPRAGTCGTRIGGSTLLISTGQGSIYSCQLSAISKENLYVCVRFSWLLCPHHDKCTFPVSVLDGLDFPYLVQGAKDGLGEGKVMKTGFL